MRHELEYTIESRDYGELYRWLAKKGYLLPDQPAKKLAEVRFKWYTIEEKEPK